MRYGVLGPLEVRAGGVSVPLPRPKERRLLAALLIRAGSPVPAGVLAEALWGDDQPSDPDRAVQTHLSRLRAALGRAAIETGPAGYRLAVDPDAVDAGRFERLCAAAGRAAGAGAALATLDEALGLWRGAAYEEFASEPFARTEAVRLEELRITAEGARIDARMALGEPDEVVGDLQALVARHPYAERMHERLAVALYRSGRQTDALAALRAYRALIAEELGLEPSPAMERLELSLLTHSLDSPPAQPAPLVGAGPSEPRSGVAELGVPSTPLIGREGLVAGVVALLARARLVTLTGPGGVGKTRVAAGAAAAAGAGFAAGVAACPLASIRDPAAVGPAVATALGVRRRRHSSVEESLVEALHPRHLLVVLDNCEHVIDMAAALAGLLTRRCPRVSVLATSRERLGLADEHVVDVPPLPIPQSASADFAGTALELFVERARAAGVDLVAEPAALEAAITVCRRLDGIPLAVELAAARVRSIRPGDIAERLSEPSAQLVGGSREAAGRHRSLRAVTDWSYELLSRPERELFDGLSVFAGTFDLDAAETVAAGAGLGAGAIASLVGGLVDKSMVAVGASPGPARYALLETLRSYGRERLAATGRRDVWRRAHARHFLDLAEQADRGLVGPDERGWVDRLGAEIDNLREARRWALDSDPDLSVRLVAALVWYRFRTMQSELDQWIEETAGRVPGHPLTPLLLGSAALAAWSRGELDLARRLAQAGLEGGATRPAQRLACDALGAVALVEGDLAAALVRFEQATELCRMAGDRFHEMWTLADRAVIRSYLDPTADVSGQMRESEAIARALGCPSALAWIAYARGEVLGDRDPERALRYLDAGAALAGEAGNRFVRGVAGISAATIRARSGDPADALRRFGELIEHWQVVGNRTQLWIMLRTLVHLLARDGSHEAAAVLLGALEASATAPPPFGPDHDRLAEAAALVAAAAGPVEVEEWYERGRSMDDRAAIAFAGEVVAAAAARPASRAP